MAASACYGPLVGRWRRELQQFCQRCGTGLMHGRTHCHLQGFQIQTSRLAAGTESDTQQLFYFARDFLLDGFGRFFSWADGVVSSTGRNAQTCSLTSNS